MTNNMLLMTLILSAFMVLSSVVNASPFKPGQGPGHHRPPHFDPTIALPAQSSHAVVRRRDNGDYQHNHGTSEITYHPERSTVFQSSMFTMTGPPQPFPTMNPAQYTSIMTEGAPVRRDEENHEPKPDSSQLAEHTAFSSSILIATGAPHSSPTSKQTHHHHLSISNNERDETNHEPDTPHSEYRPVRTGYPPSWSSHTGTSRPFPTSMPNISSIETDSITITSGSTLVSDSVDDSANATDSASASSTPFFGWNTFVDCPALSAAVITASYFAIVPPDGGCYTVRNAPNFMFTASGGLKHLWLCNAANCGEVAQPDGDPNNICVLWDADEMPLGFCLPSGLPGDGVIRAAWIDGT